MSALVVQPRPDRFIYLAGPISADPDFFLEEEARIARVLRKQGHNIICPGEIDHAGVVGQNPAYTYHDYMRDDIRFGLVHATAVCLRPGWLKSRGAATGEIPVAAAMAMECFFWSDSLDGMIDMGHERA